MGSNILMPMKKGIVTIATRHPLYGRFAYNLAVSLRAVAPHIPITIIADPVGISPPDRDWETDDA